jgi:16S rRNA (adenine1518-N6/adenine1519-N6)-dimethyltransferase
MAPLVNPSRTTEILKRYEFRPSKRLGQNFLIDANILNKIIEAADPQREDIVLEVGPGVGTVTEVLAPMVKRILAIEFDRRLLAILEDTLKRFSNVHVVKADALRTDFRKLLPDGEMCNKMVSNLPYQIAAPLLMKIVREYPEITRSVVMLQKEVAGRLLAPVGSKNFGAFTLKVRYFAEVEMVAKVSRKVFIPEPNVDSAVVRLERREAPGVKVQNRELLFDVINAAFEHRRKTIRNALAEAKLLGFSRSEVEEALKMAGIDSSKRGEALRLEDYGRLTDAFAQMAKVP